MNRAGAHRPVRRWLGAFALLFACGATPAALAGTVLYDNTGNPADTYYAAQGGAEALDDLHLASAGRIDSLVIEYFDPASGGAFTATAAVYDNPGGLDLGSSLLAGPFVTGELLRGRGRVAIALPGGLEVGPALWVGVRFSSGTAGMILNDLPSVGGSHDVYLENGGLYWFGGAPKANFGLRLVGTSGTVAVETGAPPPGVSLAPALPSPFRHETTLRFTIARPGPVRLDVFDVSGSRVRALLNESREAGPHTTRWSGRDDSGEHAPAGIYLVRLESGGSVAVRKVLFTP